MIERLIGAFLKHIPLITRDFKLDLIKKININGKEWIGHENLKNSVKSFLNFEDSSIFNLTKELSSENIAYFYLLFPLCVNLEFLWEHLKKIHSHVYMNSNTRLKSIELIVSIIRVLKLQKENLGETIPSIIECLDELVNYSIQYIYESNESKKSKSKSFLPL